MSSSVFYGVRIKTPGTNEKHVSAGCRPHVGKPELLCFSAFCFSLFGAWLLSQLDALLSFVTVCGEILQKHCERTSI